MSQVIGIIIVFVLIIFSCMYISCFRKETGLFGVVEEASKRGVSVDTILREWDVNPDGSKPYRKKTIELETIECYDDYDEDIDRLTTVWPVNAQITKIKPKNYQEENIE